MDSKEMTVRKPTDHILSTHRKQRDIKWEVGLGIKFQGLPSNP